uniref:Uncharacterized protein n=1 Tax=Rangifer tarandus platyrhynchus TaxID=3082113 RepID=A0ACB0F4X3_RANTA|nr:unnamed protein product [Rangifer tarandus platyrhynchus]
MGLQPLRGPRQSRRSDCQTQSLAQRTSCQPDNALGQRHETQSLSVGGIGQRERKTLCPECVEQMTAECGRRALTHDATRFVPKTDLGTLSGDGAKGTAGDGGSRQTPLQRVMKDCPLVPVAAGPGEDSGGSPPRQFGFCPQLTSGPREGCGNCGTYCKAGSWDRERWASQQKHDSFHGPPRPGPHSTGLPEEGPVTQAWGEKWGAVGPELLWVPGSGVTMMQFLRPFKASSCTASSHIPLCVQHSEHMAEFRKIPRAVQTILPYELRVQFRL